MPFLILIDWWFMQSNTKFSIWQIAFRPFFLFASVFAFSAMLLWILVLSGKLSAFQPYGGWFIWHGHEMVFGFVQAIAIGFLLTASRNWTGQPGVDAAFIRLVFAAWLIARVAWLWADIPNWLLALLDMAAPILAARGLAQTLSAGERAAGKDNQGHNWPFVALLLGFAVFQALYHYLLYYQSPYVSVLQRAAVLMMLAMTFWVSGRVLPFFTRARLQTPPANIPTIIKSVTMTLTWMVLPFYLLQSLLLQMGLSEVSHLFGYMLAFIALAASLGHLRLLSLFYQPGVSSEPMLWSLYLAYLWMIAGLVLLAVNIWLKTPWVHAITMGGLFSMILSMMARISLGHTGRKISALKGMALVFVLLQLAAFIRIATDLGLNQLIDGIAIYSVAAVLMLLSLLVFLFHYLPILCRPRADGKPG